MDDNEMWKAVQTCDRCKPNLPGYDLDSNLAMPLAWKLKDCYLTWKWAGKKRLINFSRFLSIFI